MYAVIRTGGKQYKVAVGDVIDIEKLDAEPGDEVEFETIFIVDGSSIIIDPEELAKAKVFGEVLDQFKGKKQLVFKFKKRKGYKKLKGHRQLLTKVEIFGIALDGEKPEHESTVAARAAKKAAKAAAAAEEEAVEEIVETVEDVVVETVEAVEE